LEKGKKIVLKKPLPRVPFYKMDSFAPLSFTEMGDIFCGNQGKEDAMPLGHE
jgi:hypothetical protein